MSSPSIFRAFVENEDWDHYCDLTAPLGHQQYILSHKHFLDAINDILSNSKNSEEVTEKLNNLHNSRKTFIDFALDHRP